jgi:hypothetical protein
MIIKGCCFYKDKVQVTNFVAKITRQVIVDDGIGKSKFLDLEIKSKKIDSPIEIRIPAKEFHQMAWLDTELPAELIMKLRYRQEVAFEIQRRSEVIETIHKIQSVGYVNVEGVTVFATADAIISADDNLENIICEPISQFENFSLPVVNPDERLKEAVSSVLSLSSIAPNNPTLGWMLLLPALRAPLAHTRPCTVVTFMVANSGSGKSTLQALTQGFFGRNFTRDSFPLSFQSTPKATERLLKQPAGVVLTQDDFVAGESAEKPMAELVIRTIGNNTQVSRIGSDLQVERSQRCRSVVIQNGESALSKVADSIQARMMYHTFDKWDVDTKDLEYHQELVSSGVYARVMVGFIRYILIQGPEMAAKVKRYANFYQSKSSDSLSEHGHSRLAQNVSDLCIGLRIFLDYCLHEKFLKEKKAKLILSEAHSTLIDLAKRQAELQCFEPRLNHVITAMRSGLIKGSFYLEDINNPKKGHKHSGNRAGYIMDGHVYLLRNLDPKILLTELKPSHATKIPNTQKAFWAFLRDLGFVTKTDPKRRRIVIRKVIKGKKREVYRVRADWLP